MNAIKQRQSCSDRGTTNTALTLVLAAVLTIGTSTVGAATTNADSQAQRTQASGPVQRPNPLPVTARVTLGPAPTGADAATLVAQDGLFIDLRTDEDLKEKGYVPILGLRRQRLPIAELQDAERTSATLRDMLARAADRPVWIGCNSGNRAALAWALLQIQDGTTPEAALAAVDQLATYEPLRDAILSH